MTERENEESDVNGSAFEGPAAPPAKGGGQTVDNVDVEFEADDTSSDSETLEGDEGASPPPPRGGGGN